MSFSKNVTGAPSVVRGRFAVPLDAVHPNCAGPTDVSHYLVYFIEVQQLPNQVPTGDGRNLIFFPLHLPLPDCGAHSVVSCCAVGDNDRTYVKPSPSARNALRVSLVNSFMLAR